MKQLPTAIDIVIPAHKKDLQILEYCIDSAKKKIVGAGRIIVISKERYSENAEWFDEALFPFSLEMARQHTGKSCGWYFQQLLKFYAPLIIPNISENVLILDSDTVFFRRVEMLDKNGVAYYNTFKETNLNRKGNFYDLVEEHLTKILPAIASKNLPRKFQEVSGITHNMVFNREILRELFHKVEEHHKSEEPFYKIFLRLSSKQHCASEYQIYFNFLLIFHPEKIRIRKLNFKNTADINIRKYQGRLKYHYCSFHSYLRDSSPNSSKIKFERFVKNFLHKLFFLEISNIGIIDCSIGEFANLPNRKIKWLERLEFATSRLNPSGLVELDGRKNIFCEERNFITQEAQICKFELGEKFEILNKKITLKNFGLAQIFCDNGQNFALVKNYKTEKFEIHKINSDNRFEKIADLLNDSEIINPSIKKQGENWWVFFTKKNQKTGQLHIAFGKNLLGDWKAHPQNPITLTGNGAHCAGEIIAHQNSLLLPLQNLFKPCSTSIALNTILDLSESNYSENYSEIGIFADQLGEYPDGLLSIASLGQEATLVSGKKFYFTPLKPFLTLINLLRFRFSNSN